MSKIKTKIYELDNEYKLTVYSGDESFDLYFDTEEDADEIADLAQSYDSFEEAQAELDSDGDGELDDEDYSEDDEDNVITEKAAGPKDIKSVVDALNNSGLLGHKLDYNFKTDCREYGVTLSRLSNAAVDAGAFRLAMFFKDEKNENNREKIVNDIINPLGYHYVWVDHWIGYAVVPKSISQSKLVELIEKGAREDYIEDIMSGEDPDYTPIFQNDKIMVYSVPSISDARFYVLRIEDITPKSFGFFKIPTRYKRIAIKSRIHDTGEDIKDAVKGSTSIKDASSKVTKYLKDNGIQYKNLK